MKRCDFIIPVKPKLVRPVGNDTNHQKEYVPSPPPHSTEEVCSKNFPKKLGPRVSEAPPHTKFTVIPSRAITDSRINSRKPLLLLLGAIGMHASVHGICYPSQSRLASICGKSKAWANKYLHELIRMGYVRRLVPPKYRGKRQALRIQVMWSISQPLPVKETEWRKAPWCWR